VETTAFALSIATFHIINTPRIYERLHADLVDAFPNRANMELYPLEQMPYLKAIILEAARMSYGLSARNPRTRSTPLVYKDWIIPARTCVVSFPVWRLRWLTGWFISPRWNCLLIMLLQSMTIPEMSHDESIFPDSRTFMPERWLDNPKTSDGIPLERFMVSFGRGTRSCLGITYVP